MTARRLGLTIPLDTVSLPEHVTLARELADRGYTDLWTAEHSGTDGVTPLALAAAVEPRLRFGTAILPAFTRGPGLLAQTAATMAEAAPGRFVLGIGASSSVVVQSWNGVAYEQPYRRARDVLRFLRRALAGEKVTERYDTFAVDGFRLLRPPAEPPPVLLAALRPQMLALAGSEADGAILEWLSCDDVPQVASVVRARRADAEIVARVRVAPTTDRDAVRAVMRRAITGYLTVPGYRAYQEWLGRGEALQPMWDAWDAGDRRAALEAVPDSVVDQLCMSGTPDECRAQVERYFERGATTVAMLLMPVGLDERAAALALGLDA